MLLPENCKYGVIEGPFYSLARSQSFIGALQSFHKSKLNKGSAIITHRRTFSTLLAHRTSQPRYSIPMYHYNSLPRTIACSDPISIYH